MTALGALPFIPSGIMKVTGGPQIIEGMAHLGVPETLLPLLATLELGSVALYLVLKTSVLGAILLTGDLGGAILCHLRIGEPAFMQAAFGVLLWGGLFLRDRRLHELIPLRR